jgi:methionyl-tRNA formyltransferase
MNKEDLRIVFFGTPEFAVESLAKLVANNFNIVGVVTMPDKVAGRGHKLFQSPVKQFALQHNLNLLQPTNLKDSEFVDNLRALNADLFIVIAFRMLPEIVWTMPPLGTFNLHASLLPKYRGAAPINWAIINGETETGVTTFFLKHEIDTGDIISRQSIKINPNDNAGTVHDRLMHIGATLTLDTVNDIINGNLNTTPQELLSEYITPTPAPKIFKDTCRINWNLPAEYIHNFVRGLSPAPAAWTNLVTPTEELQLKIFSTAIGHITKLKPGTILVDGNHLYIACADRLLEITSLQLAGKRRMNTPDFLRGFNPEPYTTA